jgi:hypothetical protein
LLRRGRGGREGAESEKDESEMKRKGDRERRKSTRQIEEREWEE